MELIKLERDNKNKIILREEKDGSGKICILGGIYIVNEISISIIKSLNNNNSITVTMEQIMEQYDISYGDLAQDTKEFLRQLLKIRVISEKLYKTYIEEIDNNAGQRNN